MPGRQLCKEKSLEDKGSCAEEKHAEITCRSNTKHTGTKPLSNNVQVKTSCLTVLLIIYSLFKKLFFFFAVFLYALNMGSYIKEFNLNLCLGPACIPHCSKAQCAAPQRAGSFLSGGQLTSRLAVYAIFLACLLCHGFQFPSVKSKHAGQEGVWNILFCRCPHVLMEV